MPKAMQTKNETPPPPSKEAAGRPCGCESRKGPYLLPGGCRAAIGVTVDAAAVIAVVVRPPAGKPGLEQPGHGLHCGQTRCSKA